LHQRRNAKAIFLHEYNGEIFRKRTIRPDSGIANQFPNGSRRRLRISTNLAVPTRCGLCETASGAVGQN
jgi:hypothetical protein